MGTGGVIDRLDLRLHQDVLGLRNGWMNEVFRTVTHLGGTPGANLPLLGLALILAIRRRNYVLPAFAYLALCAGQLIRTWLNHAIGRARPPRADWLVAAHGDSMPSGHSATVVMAYGLGLALLWSSLSRPGRRVGVAVAVVISLLVGLSRVYLGVHWPTDVLAGWTFGAAWLGLCVLAWQRFGQPHT